MPKPSLELTERSDQSTVPAAVSLTCYLMPARKHSKCLCILRQLFCGAVFLSAAVEVVEGSFGRNTAQSFRETAHLSLQFYAV